MLKKEINYDFQKELLNSHQKIIKKDIKISLEEILLPDEINIINENDDEVINTALNDLIEFLDKSLSIKAKIIKAANTFYIKTALINKKTNNAYEYQIKVTKNCVEITSNTNRGIAQAVFYLEFCLKEKRAPILKLGEEKQCMPFSPRMIHSGYYLDEYPDNYLLNIARYGYDAIIIFIKGVNKTAIGYLNFNDLIKRAKKYGIDVYGYSYLNNFIHPDDKNATQIFDSTYGAIFKECPEMKGMILVGESVEFASKDLNTTGKRYYEDSNDNIPENKPSPGWWPCKDYPKWLNSVKNSIRKYNKNADIVFWTYNWGWASKEARLELINNLPADITLQVTFEMFQKYDICGIKEIVSDYSLANAVAGDYFLSEAKAAKKRGIKLYSMVNTAGRTWDIGVVPYLPMAYSWIERFKSINDAKENYGLCGLMEGHHYGFYPNFISQLALLCFNRGDYEQNLERVLFSEFENNIHQIKSGLEFISDAIKYIPPTIEEQYSVLRVGTSYPLCLIKQMQPPQNPKAYFGNKIWTPSYGQFEGTLILGFGDNGTPYGLRYKTEILMLKKAKNYMNQGISVLKKIKNKNNNLYKLINLCEYIACTFETAINVKLFYEQKIKLKIASRKERILSIVNKIEKIALKEVCNSKKSIVFLEKDSRLGFEPSMLYCGDKTAVLWKIKQVNYMIKYELNYYKNI